MRRLLRCSLPLLLAAWLAACAPGEVAGRLNHVFSDGAATDQTQAAVLRGIEEVEHACEAQGLAEELATPVRDSLKYTILSGLFLKLSLEVVEKLRGVMGESEKR